ncbi:hypothetical protein [Streptomyces sp. NPDC000229]|uniref:hypothetical protein n=1 Tax=Streptomyces sp. NPDC000229 TaxID=3154247 RepID=UPI003327836B
MSARTHQHRTHATTVTTTGTRTATTTVTTTLGTVGSAAGARLPWWAVALPVLAFAFLFGLITGGGEAHAAGGDPAVGRILEQIQHTLAR